MAEGWQKVIARDHEYAVISMKPWWAEGTRKVGGRFAEAKNNINTATKDFRSTVT